MDDFNGPWYSTETYTTEERQALREWSWELEHYWCQPLDQVNENVRS